MTIRHTAFDTTHCNGFVLNKTQAALKAATAMGVLSYVSPDMSVVMDGDNYRDAIPAFTHPMLIEPYKQKHDTHNGPGNVLAVDVRRFGKWSQIKNGWNTMNATEYQMAMLRMRLNSVWLKEDPGYLRNFSSLPIKVFSSWISESIGRRFGLEPVEQMKLSILSAIFYASNFSNDADPSESDRVRMSGAISRDLGVIQTDVLDILDKYPHIAGVDDFCKFASDVVSTVRLKELNKGLLYACVGGTFFGVNMAEILAVALEHPPTWLAVLYMAGTDRSYRNTQLSKIFERHGARGADQQFVHSLSKLLQDLAPVNT